MAQEILNKTPFNAVALAAATFAAVIETKDVANLSIETHSTGTPTGTYTFFKSSSPKCDPSVGQAAAIASTDWVAFTPAGAPPNPAGAGGDSVFEITPFATRFLKVVYTNASGAGTYTLIVFGKGQG